MRNPIENLGDYNKAREDLQMAGGSLENLYKSVGDTAVSKATPKILFKGSLFTAALFGVLYAGHKGVCFMKNRKQKIENESALKEEFADTIKAEASKSNNKELNDDNGVF